MLALAQVYTLIVTSAIAVKCRDSSEVKGRKVNLSSVARESPGGTMDSGSSVSRSENEVGVQPSIQRSQLRIRSPLLSGQKKTRPPGRSGNYGIQESLECNLSQQDQVRRGYEPYEPIRVSTPKDCGMLPTQVKCEMGVSPTGQGVDDLFIREARQLCTLFKEQELVTHQINSNLTNLCVQLVADHAS